jgi:2,3-bisphosphoglycerate-dependent phosphoglycerate mutase
MAAAHILLIRHAQAENDGRFRGVFDIPLTAQGRATVCAALERPPTRSAPKALYTSPLRRAREVATELGRAWRLEPTIAEWAHEIDGGAFEGARFDQLRRDYPELWAYNARQADDGFAWPGGETYARFRARVLIGVTQLAEAHQGRCVAVVTHAGVISQVLGAIRSRPACVWVPDRPDLFTATEIVWGNGSAPTVLSYNEPDWW